VVERAGIGRFFAWVVTSVDAGFRKPALEFFDFALAKCALSKDEVLFVGNQLSTNIRVASNTESALSGYADALTAVLMKHSRPRMFAPPTQSALFANFRFCCNASAILKSVRVLSGGRSDARSCRIRCCARVRPVHWSRRLRQPRRTSGQNGMRSRNSYG